MSRFGPRRVAMLAVTVLLAALLSPAAGAKERPRLAGAGSCSGIAGLYLAAIADGGATLVSGADFPGGSLADRDLGELTSYRGSLWAMSVGRLPAGSSGCIAFDKDLFTWPGDVATYVQYLVRQLLTPAQQLDPTVRTLAIGSRSLRLEVSRPGADAAILSGPEGAMLGYGRRSDPERYFILPVVVGAGDKLLVRIFRNHGEPFGERSTELLGTVLVPAGVGARSQTTPVFELRWVDPPG